MKYLFFIAFFVSCTVNSQDLKQIRSLYPEAEKSSEVTSKLEAQLSNIIGKNASVLKAYQGAVLTLKARFSKSKEDKKAYFKKGVFAIESALKDESSNVEIRYLRLSVQENSPRFLGYHKNIEEDKEFILKNYDNISPEELKNLIKDFVLKSDNFSNVEKQQF